MNEDFDVTLYRLMHRRKSDDEWVFSSLDVFYVDSAEYKKNYDGYCVCGQRGWFSKKDALSVLLDMQQAFPDQDFKMAKYHLQRECLEVIRCYHK